MWYIDNYVYLPIKLNSGVMLIPSCDINPFRHGMDDCFVQKLQFWLVFSLYILESYVIHVFLCIFPQRHIPGVILVHEGNFNPIRRKIKITKKKCKKSHFFIYQPMRMK